MYGNPIHVTQFCLLLLCFLSVINISPVSLPSTLPRPNIPSLPTRFPKLGAVCLPVISVSTTTYRLYLGSVHVELQRLPKLDGCDASQRCGDDVRHFEVARTGFLAGRRDEKLVSAVDVEEESFRDVDSRRRNRQAPSTVHLSNTSMPVSGKFSLQLEAYSLLTNIRLTNDNITVCRVIYLSTNN